MMCGAGLDDGDLRGEERKVVTVLFADLVGFTSQSERMDVEDVRGTLQPYHALLRRELERYGGTVEKFIGDAVMALFGAPVAHEDDPERAVRAALSIQEAVFELREVDRQLDLHVRIGVNTGEALVDLQANPTTGEGMASGDVVNTAARLQSAAPVDGVLVGEATHRATRRVVEYAEAEPIHAKGKRAPVRGWVAQRLVDRPGRDIEDAPSAPLVGRDLELGVLCSALERATRDGCPQLLTLTGVPGIGKSRLVSELRQRAERDSITWLQGRSLPYGEGVAFWALGEIVKAQAKVLHSDAAESAGGKLHQAVAELIPDERDAGWVEQHLRPLLGLEAAHELAGDAHAEAFAAWRRFIEELAQRGPTVLVFEDLHWADEALLEFIDHLVERTGAVPLLVLCTARPELLDRRRSWGGGSGSAISVALSPLSDEDTGLLIAALVDRAVVPLEARTPLLTRAAGNPLYAHEHVAMLIDRGFLKRRGEDWTFASIDQLPVPESVQGLIAARIDGLTPVEKRVLQDAAVIGRMTWVGAVAHVGGTDRWVVDEQLHSLARKQFLRREPESSVAGETEYVFQHALIRDVAYAGIVRSSRAAKHQRAATWNQALSESRDDRIEILAHHYQQAFIYAVASGTASDRLRECTWVALRHAGDRAMELNSFAGAVRHYSAALEILPIDAPSRALVLLALGKARLRAEDALPDTLVQAAGMLVATGAFEAAAEAETLIGLHHLNHGSLDGEQNLEHAVQLLDNRPASASKEFAFSALASHYINDGYAEKGLPLCEEALQLADELNNPQAVAIGLMFLGRGNLLTDDPAARLHFNEAYRIAEGTAGFDTVLCYANLALSYRTLGEYPRWIDALDQATRRAERLAAPYWLRDLAFRRLLEWYDRGRWDEAAAASERLLAEIDLGEGGWFEPELRILYGRIQLARGDGDRAVQEATTALACAEGGGDRYATFMATLWLYRVLTDLGESDQSRVLGSSIVSNWRQLSLVKTTETSDLAYCVEALGLESDFKAAASAQRTPSNWTQAAISLADQSSADAADLYAKVGSAPDEAYARLRAGRLLISEGHEDDGRSQLEESLAFWRSVNATANIRAVEACLSGAGL
jgi:class 3 adenylate cyclase/tetratricopeptide (TPR) repeat protein